MSTALARKKKRTSPCQEEFRGSNKNDGGPDLREEVERGKMSWGTSHKCVGESGDVEELFAGMGGNRQQVK